MGDRVRIFVAAMILLAAAGGAALWAGAFDPQADGPTQAVQVFPAPEHWPGVRWSAIDDPVLGGQGTNLFGLTSYGSWIVAWGDANLPDAAVQGGLRWAPVVWTSRGGQDWRRFEPKLVTGEPFYATSIALGPAGYLAFGSRVGDEQHVIAALSGDGEHWVDAGRQPLDGGPLLIATPTGFMATGERAGRSIVLSTSDGVGWEQVQIPARAGEYQLNDVRLTPDGFVLAGMIKRARDWDGLILRSSSGNGLVELTAENPMFTGPDRGVAVWRTVPFAGGTLAMGSAGEIPECQLIGRVASLAPITADMCFGPPEAAWVSVDGHRWREVEGPRPGGNRSTMFSAITTGAAGLVALIEEAPFGAQQGNYGLWTSGDGVEWSRIGDGMPSEPNAGASTLVGMPGRVVGFGRSEKGISVWVGTPGG